MNGVFKAELLSKRLRNNLYFYGSTDSTSTRLKALAKAGAEEGTAVAADSQTEGRGRLGRSFLSEKGRGVYMSVLLRPDCGVESALSLTASSAVAVCRALERFGVSADIKWVNDLFINGKKICGILCESALDTDGRLLYAVIGIGINVLGSEFPEELRGIAGSVESQCGKAISREELCDAVYDELWKMYLDWQKDSACCLNDYRRRCFIIGKSVRVFSPEGERLAEVLGIDDAFGLTVSVDGKREILRASEVSVRV